MTYTAKLIEGSMFSTFHEMVEIFLDLLLESFSKIVYNSFVIIAILYFE